MSLATTYTDAKILLCDMELENWIKNFCRVINIKIKRPVVIFWEKKIQL